MPYGLLVISHVLTIGSTPCLAKLFGEWSLVSGWAGPGLCPLRLWFHLPQNWHFEARLGLSETVPLPCNISPSFILSNFCFLFISLFLSLLAFLWMSITIYKGKRQEKGIFPTALYAQRELIDEGTSSKGLLHGCSSNLTVESGLSIGRYIKCAGLNISNS